MMCAIWWKATTQYAYEVGGKLKQVTLPDSSTVTYAYDALGNRIRKLSSSLDIHYQYSQGACRREIHKDPATQNILRTITYHPWGMSISNNQTSTDYYFITDFRGWVWGLTDDSGTLVESYNYDPFGKILAGSLLSHARFLSGAHEGQWDGEVGLYYLGARYYDPSLGRFIQEDAVEGSADLPASQNRYIYCQNDPVSLIDPTGYSPENTGTPARFNLSNLGNFGGASSTACILPDTSQYFAKGDGIWWGDDSPGEGRIWNNPFDACGEYSVVDTGRKDKQGNTIYLVTVGGVSVYISVDKNGKVTAQAGRGLTPTQQAIVKGLEDGFKNIVSRGGKLSSFNILAILQDSVTYAEKNLTTFGAMYTGSGNVIEVFFKHAVTGAAIKQEMAGDEREDKNLNHPDDGRFDMDFGFWTSFFVEKWEAITGEKAPWLTNRHYIPGKPDDELGVLGNSKLGMVDIARVMKAIMYCEKSSYSFDPRFPYKDYDGEENTHPAYGLMQLHREWFAGEDPNRPNSKGSARTDDILKDLRGILRVDWKRNAFANIGGGVGHFFHHMRRHGLKNSLDNFRKGAAAYNAGAAILGTDYEKNFTKELWRNLGKRHLP